MKLALSGTLLLTMTLGLAAPAHAVTILPNLFAKRYCDLRAIGATKDDAISIAINDSTIPTDNWVMVTRPDGRKTRSDSIEAARAAAARCPQYIQ